jgi:hypothetical protein
MNALPVQLPELKPTLVRARASQFASAVCGQLPGIEHGTVGRPNAGGTMRKTVANMTDTKSFTARIYATESGEGPATRE